MQTVTVKQAAKILGVHPHRIYQRIQDGSLGARKVRMDNGTGLRYMINLPDDKQNGNGAVSLRQRLDALELRLTQLYYSVNGPDR